VVGQRGSKGKTNDLLRHYLQRRLEFHTLPQAAFDAIAQGSTNDLDRLWDSRQHHGHWRERCVNRLIAPELRMLECVGPFGWPITRVGV
jgi:hypothetical protein